jgi:hypothetical protein
MTNLKINSQHSSGNSAHVAVTVCCEEEEEEQLREEEFLFLFIGVDGIRSVMILGFMFVIGEIRVENFLWV